MGVKIQIRRGNQADLPTLDTGEFGFTIDTERLYIGNPSGSGNTLINFGGAGFDMGNGADGYVTFYTGPNAIGGDNDFFWDRENNRLGIHCTTPTHELTIDGYIVPFTDNVHQLGTPTQRWEALWLGPGSLHIHSNPSETFTSFDWRIGIDQTTGNEGKLIFAQGDQTYLAVDPVTGNVSFSAGDELRVSGALVLPELASPPLNETGYGKVYVDAGDQALHFLNSVGTDYNLLITGGTGTGNVDYTEGADGYVTFFIAPGVIAGDNDFFFNRENHNLTLMGGGKVGVGITAPTSPFHAQLESAGTFYQAWTGGSAQFDLAAASSPSNIAIFESWNGLHILLRPNSGFVGINSSIATPANALDVSGAASIGSGYYGTTAPTNGLRVQGLVALGTTSSPGTTALLIDQAGTDTSTISGRAIGSATFDIVPRSAPDRLDITTSNLRTLILSPAGNGVGISTGTTNVANKLDVAGSVAIGSGYIGTFAGSNNLIVQGSIGIGTVSPYEALTINGIIALQEQDSTPDNVVDGYGRVYVKSDNKLYFQSGLGTEFDLTSGGTVQASEGSDGYVTFFTGANTIAGDNDFFFDRTNNRLGLGTSTPNARFHIAGGDGAEDDGSSKFEIWQTVGGARGFLHAYAGSELRFGSSTNVPVVFYGNNAQLMWLTTGGSLGVGTASPGSKISTNGNVSIGSSYATTSAPSNGMIVEGSVGIGTTTPQNKLDVEGAAVIGATYSGTNAAPANGLLVEGEVGIGTTSVTTGPLAVVKSFNGDARIGITNTNAGSAALADIRATSDVADISILALSSAYSGTTTDGVALAQSTLLQGLTSDRLFIITSNPAPIHVAVNNTSILTITNDKNVGIGTVSPIEPLTVNGPIALQELTADAATQDGYGKLYVRDDNKLYYKDGLGVEFDLTSGGGTLTATEGSDGYVAFFTGSNTLAGDNDFFWDRVNNRLGVGTSSTTSHKLHVTGTNTNVALFQGLGDGGGTSKLSVIATDNSGNYTATIDVGSTATVFGHNTSGRDLILQTNSTDRFTITGSAGLVGIGATPGTYRLTTHSADANIAVFQANNGSGTPRLVITGSDTSGNYSATIDVGPSRVSFGHNVSSRDLVFQTNSTNAIYILGSNQNVGIGTTAANEKLTVEGAISLDEISAPSATAGYGKIYVKSSDSLLYFKDDAGNEYSLTTGGGVTATQGFDGYVTFFTGTSTIAGDNDFFWERVNNRLFIGNNAPAIPRKLTINVDAETGDGIGIVNSSNSAAGFAQIFLQSDLGFLLIDQFSSGYTGTTTHAGGTISQSNMGFIGTSSSSQGLIIHSSNGQYTHLGAGNKVFLHLSPDNNVGIGTLSPIEPLTVNGPIALQELTADAATQDGYGKLYVRDDNKLYYKDGLGVEFDLTSAGGGVTAAQGSDGYLAFFTSSNAIAGDNDLFYDRVSSRLSVATASLINPNASLVVGGTILSVFEDEARGAGFQITSPIGAARYGLKYGSAGNLHDSIVLMLANREANGPIAFATDNGASGAAGEVERMRIAGGTETRVGIGTSSPIEALTINGTLALQELDVNPATEDGYGKIFVKDDNKLYYKDGAGGVFDLTAAAGVSASQGADGYIAFFTGATTLAGDNDFFYDRVNNRLGLGTSTPATKVEIMDGDHTYVRINSPLAFQAALAFADTTNGQDWVLYRVQGSTDLALHSSGIPGNLLYFTNVSTDGYVLPGTDLSNHLGNPTTRWESLYLGPSSLHFRTTAAETVEALDWTMGVGTSENKGDLLFYQSGHKNVRFRDEGGISITATKQYHGLSINNGINLAAQLIGFTANNDGGGLDLLTGGVTRVRLNADAAVPNYINHQGALGIGTNNPTTTSRLHIVVASGGGDVIRMSRDVSFDWDLGISSASDLFLEEGGGTRHLHITSGTGRFGLGTSTPQNRLDVEGGAVIGASYSGTNTAPTNGLLVEGAMAIGHSSNNSAQLNIRRADDGGAILRLERSTAYQYAFRYAAAGNNLLQILEPSAGAPIMIWDGDNNRVGIGTGATAPSNKLEVRFDTSSEQTARDVMAVTATLSTGTVGTGFGPRITFNAETATADNIGQMAAIGAVWEDPTLASITGALTFYTRVNSGGFNERMRISGIGNVGIGTAFPIEPLTVNGPIALQELTADAATQDGYGKLYVRDDNKLYYKDGLGVEFDLTSAGGGITATEGSDGYVAFFTGSNSIAGDNDFFFNRENNRLTLGGGGTYAGSNGTAANPTYATGSGNTGVFEDDSGNLAFSIAGTQYFQMTAAGFITTTAGGLISVAQGNTVNTAYSSNAGANTGIFFPSGPQVAIAISGTEVMRATTDRRVAIGTTTADAMLHVAGDGYFDGYLMPHTDNMWGLGTPSLRWRDLYLGPESLHIISKDTDDGRPNKDFRWTVDEGGILTLSEDSTPVASFSSAGVSFPAGGGAASAPQYTISASQTTGFTASFDTVYRCDPSGGGFTVTLPASSGGTGKTIIVKNTTSSTNTITIQTTGGELIDGSSTVTIEMGYTAITFVSYGTGWGRI